MLAFYKSYRACVRAKVAALRADQLRGDQQQRAAGEAVKHLELGDSYARSWIRPLVIAIGGLSGTGKTTLARALAKKLGNELLRTDVLRQEVDERLPGHRGSGPSMRGADRYSPESRRRVYDALFVRAHALIVSGVSVVLDGTFSTNDAISAASQLVGDNSAKFLAIQCICDPAVARKRIAARQRTHSDISEATPQLHDEQRAAWENWPAEVPQIKINTEAQIEGQVQQVLLNLAATA